MQTWCIGPFMNKSHLPWLASSNDSKLFKRTDNKLYEVHKLLYIKRNTYLYDLKLHYRVQLESTDMFRFVTLRVRALTIQVANSHNTQSVTVAPNEILHHTQDVKLQRSKVMESRIANLPKYLNHLLAILSLFPCLTLTMMKNSGPCIGQSGRNVVIQASW